MMNSIETIISDINSDIEYFDNIGFDRLSKKFKRDLNVINELLSKLNNKQVVTEENINE